MSDRDAVEQLRVNIAWKVAAGRPLDDPGFHPTVLTLWRNKLRVSQAPERIFDAVRAVIAAWIRTGRRGGYWGAVDYLKRYPFEMAAVALAVLLLVIDAGMAVVGHFAPVD